MCIYLTNGNFLGQRLIGYDFYDSKSKGFVGMTEKQVITKLKNKEARHARVEYTEDKLKMMLELNVPVAGVRLDKNRLVACEGVEIISNEEEVKEGA